MRLLGAAGLPMISIALCHGSMAYADEFFEIERIENHGRSVAVEFADLNGSFFDQGWLEGEAEGRFWPEITFSRRTIDLKRV